MTDPGTATLNWWRKKQRIRDWTVFAVLVLGILGAIAIFAAWPQWGWLAFVVYFAAAFGGGITWIVNGALSYIIRTPSERR